MNEQQQAQPVDRTTLEEWAEEMQRKLSAEWRPKPEIRHVPIWDAEREEDWRP
jgi:hypothetical protein